MCLKPFGLKTITCSSVLLNAFLQIVVLGDSGKHIGNSSSTILGLIILWAVVCRDY